MANADPDQPVPESVPSDLRHPTWDRTHPGMDGVLCLELILVRHAESGSNRKLMTTEKVVGPEGRKDPDSELTPRGEQQAELTRAFIGKLDKHYTTFETSPLKRARATCGGDGYTVQFNLREHNYRAEFDTGYGMSPPESDAGFALRVQTEIRRWTAHMAVDDHVPAPKRVVVCTHSLFIAEVLKHVCGCSANAMFHLGNASITVIHFTMCPRSYNHNVEIQMVGSVDHLPVELRTGHHTALYYTSK